jgi:Outer membrane protein beta-barrel domain
MKNLLIALSILSFVSNASAQEAADKDVQAGLVLGYGMTLQKMETKLLEKNGIGSDLTIGANVNFSLTETIGFCTGVEFDFESLKYNTPSSDTVIYFYKDNDNSIVKYGEIDPTNSAYMMSSRKQKAMYLTIPTMLSFRTNFIGYFRYFGKFGLRTSVLLSNKINDEGSNLDMTDGSIINNDANVDMTASGEMFPIKSAVGLAGGAEWNFTGSTVLMAEIGYYYGFTPLYNNRKDEKTYWQSSGSPDTPPVFSNKAKQSQLMFKLSILF